MVSDKEDWVPIRGYEGFYEISRTGKIKSLSRVIYNSRSINKQSVLKETILTWSFALGYAHIRLRKDGKASTFKIHRLLAETFIENPLNKTVVNHINGLRGDNSLENLEWCTPGENQKHAYDTGLRRRFTQENHPKSRKVMNKETKEVYPSMKALAEAIGVPHSILKSRLNGTYKNNTIYEMI